MICGLIKYYKREIFTYVFLSIMPVIFLAEMLIYLFETSGHDEAMLMSFRMIMAMCIVSGIGLAISQTVSNIGFLRELKKLSPDVSAATKAEAKTGIKRGRYFLTRDVLIYYGFLKKKVFIRNQISRWKRNKGIHSQSVPKAGRVNVPFDNTIIYFKTGSEYGYMEKIEYPIDPLESEKATKGELPYNGILAVFISIVFCVSMIVYPRILLENAPTSIIEGFLFRASHEADYCLTAVIITAIAGVAGFIVRCIIKPLNLKKDKLKTRNRLTVSFILLTVTAMFIAGFYGTEKKDALLILEDLDSYYAGEYSVIEGKYEEGEISRGEVGWDIYDYANRKGYAPVFLERPGCQLILLKGTSQINPEEEKEYEVRYLDNTRIIISIAEKD